MRLLLTACLLGLSLPAVARAEVSSPESVRRHQAFEQVIDTRCILCHTRERIDEARRGGGDLGAIQQRMLDRGAVLTEEEKSTMRALWGDPLKP